MIRVLIVDDEELFRTGLRMVLHTADDITVVGECTATEAPAAIAESAPDVVLLDIRMPDRDGLAVLEDVKGRPGAPSVLMLTSFDSDAYVARALQAGADGFLLKDSDPAYLARAVRAAAAGGSALSPSVARSVVEGYVSSLTGERERGREGGKAETPAPQPAVADADERVAQLTPREREVLALLGAGLSNREIATELHLSPGTVKEHVSTVLAKLGTDNRVRAAVIAWQSGLVGSAADLASHGR
ncbi:response regulator [Streptomyces hiroshimensis]|uniref:DNA-binding response regulator n=1 Tax=Streptomyces hiroshimensis TaxID=66424 RepID=A0ABQ2ZAY1_9ACTN|nr:response regulator transcription factor [Streptomyces hiroshimensis]GGY06962.1 DNA-binding response regulator [Streptomyces hiroshimensis]